MLLNNSNRVRFEKEGFITIFTGKVELGQGVKQAFTSICSTELSVGFEQVCVVCGDTLLTPNEGITAGSLSIEIAGLKLRDELREIKAELLKRAEDRLRASKIKIISQAGRFFLSNKPSFKVDYWDLLTKEEQILPEIKTKKIDNQYSPFINGVKLFEKVTSKQSLESYALTGGKFIQDLCLPDMLHGRILRPPTRVHRLKKLDSTSVKMMSGVIDVVVKGSFMGVIAETEYEAINAVKELEENSLWDKIADVVPYPHAIERILHDRSDQKVVLERGKTYSETKSVISATYFRPFILHGSVAPSAAAACFNHQKELTVWSHTQGPFQLRVALSELLKMDEEKIRVIHVNGAGCYGHNGADDAALDAVLLAFKVVGRPVMVKWDRSDEHKWEPMGTAMFVKCTAYLDSSGKIIRWEHETHSHSHSTRPNTVPGFSGFLASEHFFQQVPPSFLKNDGRLTSGQQRNAEPLYNFPEIKIVSNFVRESSVRVSALRSLGAYANVFAIESFVDEIALKNGFDPIDFRLKNLSDYRAKEILIAAVDEASSYLPVIREGFRAGRGVGLAQYKNLQAYVAIVCDLDINITSGLINLRHATIAADAGEIIDQQGIRNQLEGGFLQSASWTLKEKVVWDQKGQLPSNWGAYPVLRFTEIPTINVRLIDRPYLPSLGVGEAAQGPSAGAIANAIFSAIGVRLRNTPFTPECVKKTLN